MTTRRRLTTQQIDRRIQQLQRSITLKTDKLVRDGVLTLAEIDEIDEAIHRTPEPDPRIGSVVSWDGTNYIIEGVTDTDVILAKLTAFTNRPNNDPR